MRRRLFVMLAAALLAGCTVGPQPPPTPTSMGAGPETASPFLWDPVDPALPEITQTSGDARKVKGDWEVASIDYLYRWIGLGSWVFDHQQLRKDGDGYRRDGETVVSPADVAALVASLDRLYPIQRLLGGNAWTDDYPDWAVELVGTDGQRVLLTSDSTGNPGNGPWNVLINGRLYAQYDGAIGEALGKVFESRLGEPAGAFVPGGREPGQVAFETQGLPPQLSVGYAGLIPLYERFEYRANREAGRIEGEIKLDRTGGRTMPGDEDKQAGRVVRISNMKLPPPGGSEVQCDLREEQEPGDQNTVIWRFTCPMQIGEDGTRYRIPITVDGTTAAGDDIAMSGELWGVWGSQGKTPLLPPPAAIAAGISSSPNMADLASDHTIISSSYSASLIAGQPLMGERSGDVMLLGRKTVDGREVSYTVSKQFALRDGKITFWELSRAELNVLLDDMIKLPLTARVLETDPGRLLDLTYSEGEPERVSTDVMGGFAPRSYSLNLGSCGDTPATTLPGEGTPLRGISYGFGTVGNEPQFVLVDGQTVANHISVGSEPNAVWAALMPDALKTGTTRPFDSIVFEATTFGGSRVPRLTLRPPADATAEEMKVYEEKVAALPVEAKKQDNAWVIEGVTLAVTDEGKLEVRACGN
jgi:hypothetical protein